MVPAKTPPQCRHSCLFTLSDLTAVSRASTYLYNKAHLMCVRFRIMDDIGKQQPARHIAWSSCWLRFFEADKRNQLSRVRVLSGGMLTPIEHATQWDSLVPEGPDQESTATRLAADAEHKGMYDLAALLRRRYGLHPRPNAQRR